MVMHTLIENFEHDLICAGAEEGEVMSWENRMKVVCGAARALRYLHEDCRVGCIIHRDFRPNNILVTHDFEPMVSHQDSRSFSVFFYFMLIKRQI